MNTLAAVVLAVVATLAVVWIAHTIITAEHRFKDTHRAEIDRRVRAEMNRRNPPAITHGTDTHTPTPPWVADMSRRVEYNWADQFGGKDVRDTIRDAARAHDASLPPIQSTAPGETKPLDAWQPPRQSPGGV